MVKSSPIDAEGLDGIDRVGRDNRRDVPWNADAYMNSEPTEMAASEERFSSINSVLSPK